MSEHDLQKSFFDWANLKALTDPRYQWFFAVPNGGWRHIVTAVRLKEEGVKRGVCDVFIPIKTDKYIGGVIEFKHGKNEVTDEQELWLEHFKSQGWATCVAYDLDTAKAFTTKLLGKYVTIQEAFDKAINGAGVPKETTE